MQQLLTSYFWFGQPPIVFGLSDRVFAYLSIALFVLSILLWATRRFFAPVVQKLTNKISNLSFSIGLSGIIWWALRYENTPIFSQRFWPGLIYLVGLVWGIFVLKYLLLSFPKEKRDFEKRETIKRYMP